MYNMQQIAQAVKKEAKRKKIPFNVLLPSCNLNINAISDFAKGQEMSLISFARIALELDCSIDFLLGRTDNPEAHKTQNSYSISNQDTIVNGTQANVINNEPIDSEVWELAQLIKSLPIVKRAEAILAVEEIKNRE